jgi:hypothetical protein
MREFSSYLLGTATCRSENSLGTKYWYSESNYIIIPIVTASFKILMQMNTVNSFQSHLSISASVLKEKRNRKF